MDVMERAVYYLNIKPRSKNQMIRYLEEKGYNEEEIRDTVTKLEEYKYLDDLSFCRMCFELGFEKGRGLMRIRRELEDKGVDREIIDSAFETMEDIPDQRELALKVAEGAMKGIDAEEIAQMTYEDRRRLQARIARRLSGRGFSSDIVYSVVRELVAV